MRVKNKRVKAIIMMNLSCLFTLICSICIKELSSNLPEKVHVIDMCFVRSLTLFLMSIMFVEIYRVNPVEQIIDASRQLRRKMLVRTLLGPIAVTLPVLA